MNQATKPSHLDAMRKFRERMDANGAAEYLARLTGTEQSNAMDAAMSLGIRPEFYGQNIRVYMPSFNDILRMIANAKGVVTVVGGILAFEDGSTVDLRGWLDD